ncbi:hypothetical protein CC2G_000046 [Coprinopsis cinerea AmutBmut pab1-1]|nr:hypothetical protein CC2G_000046 [Coprinopsis cinerea AmutBmut pab1-1]
MTPPNLTEVQNRDEPSVGHINSLPPDVLLDIFEQYVKPGPVLNFQDVEWAWKAATPNNIEYLPGRNENSPLTIDQVCKAWHQLCRGNSGLYNDIHVINPTRQDVARVWPKLKGWDYTFTLGRNIDWNDLAFPLLTTLHLQDKATLYLRSEDSFFKRLVTRACATSTRLTDIRLDPTFAFVNIIGEDPLNDGLRPYASTIPWKNLTSLTLAIRHVAEMLPILRLCPLLQKLYLEPDMCWTSSREESVGEPVFLPNLWCLVLSANVSNDNTFLPLSYLKVPALKSLSLHTPGKRVLSGLDDNPPRKSIHLLGPLTAFHGLNPDCRIQTFSSFQKWDLRDHGYRQILSLPIFEDLISFKTHDTIGDEILEWMTWDRTSDDPQVLPKLQTFSAHVHAKDGVVSRMVASRVLDVPTPVLRKVHAVFIQGPKRESEWETRLRPSMEWIGYSVR